MLGQYLPILALLVLGVVFVALSFMASTLLAPRRSTRAKRSPYECGIQPTQDTPDRFPVRFFLVAMIFVVFDIEIIFLYPWATIFRQLGLFGLVSMFIFSFAIFESFLYLIGNGALDWGPIKSVIRRDMVNPSRSTTSTIRRVGSKGRSGYLSASVERDPEAM